MIEIQKSINEWQDETFPDATPTGVLFHLFEEMDEFRSKAEQIASEDRLPTVRETLDLSIEAADIIILIYAWAHKHGIDDIHSSAVDAKMYINRRRKWNIQDDGTGRHK